MFNWRKEPRQPDVPRMPSIEAAVNAVLAKDGPPVVQTGQLLVTANDGGCYIQQRNNIGGMQAAISQLNVVRECVKRRGYTAELVVTASVPNSWLLLGGIRRRTSSGSSTITERFRSEQEARTWMATPMARKAMHSHTLHWSVSVAPYRWLPRR